MHIAHAAVSVAVAVAQHCMRSSSDIHEKWSRFVCRARQVKSSTTATRPRMNTISEKYQFVCMCALIKWLDDSISFSMHRHQSISNQAMNVSFFLFGFDFSINVGWLTRSTFDNNRNRTTHHCRHSSSYTSLAWPSDACIQSHVHEPCVIVCSFDCFFLRVQLTTDTGYTTVTH